MFAEFIVLMALFISMLGFLAYYYEQSLEVNNMENKIETSAPNITSSAMLVEYNASVWTGRKLGRGHASQELEMVKTAFEPQRDGERSQEVIGQLSRTQSCSNSSLATHMTTLCHDLTLVGYGYAIITYSYVLQVQTTDVWTRAGVQRSWSTSSLISMTTQLSMPRRYWGTCIIQTTIHLLRCYRVSSHGE